MQHHIYDNNNNTSSLPKLVGPNHFYSHHFTSFSPFHEPCTMLPPAASPSLPPYPTTTGRHNSASSVASTVSSHDSGNHTASISSGHSSASSDRDILSRKLHQNWLEKFSDLKEYDDSLTNLNWLHTMNPMKLEADVASSSDSSPSSSPRPRVEAESSEETSPTRAALLDSEDRLDYRSSPGVKPPYSYASLICMAMRELGRNKITLSDIYNWITDNFMYYRVADSSWQNSVRHNLSLNKCFEKVARRKDEPGKGGFWRINPKYADQLESGLSKRRRTLPQLIRGPGTPSNQKTPLPSPPTRSIPPTTRPIYAPSNQMSRYHLPPPPVNSNMATSGGYLPSKRLRNLASPTPPSSTYLHNYQKSHTSSYPAYYNNNSYHAQHPSLRRRSNIQNGVTTSPGHIGYRTYECNDRGDTHMCECVVVKEETKEAENTLSHIMLGEPDALEELLFAGSTPPYESSSSAGGEEMSEAASDDFDRGQPMLHEPSVDSSIMTLTNEKPTNWSYDLTELENILGLG